MFLTLFLSLFLEVAMTPMETMVLRNVLVETDEGRCSGVILTTGLVLTVFHALEVDSTVRVNGKEATIVLARPDIDLIVLKVETEEVPSIVFVMNAAVDTPVIQVGNPLGKVGMVSRGHVVYMDEKSVYTDTVAMFGYSGGGVYTETGELLAIVQKMMGTTTGGSWVTISLKSDFIVSILEGAP